MTTAEILEGSQVTVLAIKKRGVVIRCLRGDSYVVAVGQLSMTVKREGLEPCKTNKTQPSDSTQPKAYYSERPRSRGVQTLDLHGYTVVNAISTLESWLNSAILQGCTQLQVIHGLGSGKIQKAVHATLSQYKVVRAFSINHRNPGATDIFIG